MTVVVLVRWSGVEFSIVNVFVHYPSFACYCSSVFFLLWNNSFYILILTVLCTAIFNRHNLDSSNFILGTWTIIDIIQTHLHHQYQDSITALYLHSVVVCLHRQIEIMRGFLHITRLYHNPIYFILSIIEPIRAWPSCHTAVLYRM